MFTRLPQNRCCKATLNETIRRSLSCSQTRPEGFQNLAQKQNGVRNDRPPKTRHNAATCRRGQPRWERNSGTLSTMHNNASKKSPLPDTDSSAASGQHVNLGQNALGQNSQAPRPLPTLKKRAEGHTRKGAVWGSCTHV